MPILIVWLLQTSVMPLVVGGATGAMTGLVWKGCAMSPGRRAVRVAAGAWLAHLAVVGSGLVREGSVFDYGAVVAACVAVGAWACRRAR